MRQSQIATAVSSKFQPDASRTESQARSQCCGSPGHGV